MTLRTIFTLTTILLLNSCGPRTGTSGNHKDNNSTLTTPDPNQVKYFKNVLTVGPKLFKLNCVPCHCGPYSHCEPPYSGELRPFFDGLPMDSLAHYEAYIKNSVQTKRGLRKSPFITSDIAEYNHDFEKNLSDSLVKTIIEYIWLGYKHTD